MKKTRHKKLKEKAKSELYLVDNTPERGLIMGFLCIGLLIMIGLYYLPDYYSITGGIISSNKITFPKSELFFYLCFLGTFIALLMALTSRANWKDKYNKIKRKLKQEQKK